MSNTPNPNVFFRSEDMGIGNFPIKGGEMSDQPINDGGPAFPTMDPNEHYRLMGMTLRDYFAAAALQPLVTSAIELDHVKWDATAQHAYLIADAMLKAREGK
jgi:hypothetical protein